MKNIYKSLIETILLVGLFVISSIALKEVINPIEYGIMYFGAFSIWGKSYQYYSKKGTKAE